MPGKRWNKFVSCIALLALQAVLFVQARSFWQQSFCHGRDNGKYADPEDCRAYYHCSHGTTTFVWNLGTTGLMYDPKREATGWAWQVDCPIRRVYREIWRGVLGNKVTNLVKDNRFPCSPSNTSTLDTFCLYKQHGYGTNYGQRLRSFFRAPTSGVYEFETSCDNSCEVWLSTDKSPNNSRKIIDQKRWVQRHEWNVTDEQLAKPIYLVQDKLYYLELLHKQDHGPNFACLGVKIPTLGFSQRPVSSRYLELSSTQKSSFNCKNHPNPKPTPKRRTTQEMVKELEVKSKQLQAQLLASPPPGKTRDKHMEDVTMEFSVMVDKMLGDDLSVDWQAANASNAMNIAMITDDFGRTLADAWNNDSAPLIVTSSTLLLQAAVLRDRHYKFPSSKAVHDSSSDNMGDSLEIKLTAGVASSRSNVKVFSALYKNLNEHILSKPGQRGGLQSKVISTLLTSKETDVNVIIHFKNANDYNNSDLQPSCSWWKAPPANASEEGTWSSEGCVMMSRNQTHTTCSCNHLTNFAVLMRVTQHDTKLSKTHQHALSIITYIGCGLSLLGVTLTTLIFTCTRGLRSKRNLIHLNLSLNIGILQVIFLAGIEATSNQIVCRLVTALLHYFCLVSFAWMLVEGIFLYIMVVSVFDSHKDFMKLYIGCSYGVPAALVIVSVGSAYEGYGTKSVCWLAVENGVIYAFVAPALACILVNMVFLFLVIKEIIDVQSKGATGDKSTLAVVRSGLKSAVVLLPLLGLTWLFGVLALSAEAVAFQYLFAICNSLQVRRALDRSREIWLSKHGNFMTTTHSSTSKTGNKSSTHDIVFTKATGLSSRTARSTSDRKSSYTEVTINPDRKYLEHESEAFVQDTDAIDVPISDYHGNHLAVTSNDSRRNGTKVNPASSPTDQIGSQQLRTKLPPLKNTANKKQPVSKTTAPRKAKSKDKRPASRSSVQPSKHV